MSVVQQLDELALPEALQQLTLGDYCFNPHFFNEPIDNVVLTEALQQRDCFNPHFFNAPIDKVVLTEALKSYTFGEFFMIRPSEKESSTKCV